MRDLKSGEIITKDHIRRIRPGYGLPPKFFDSFINKSVNRNISRGERVTWDIIKNK